MKLLAAQIAITPPFESFYGDCRVPQRVTSAGVQGVDFPQSIRICRAMFEIYNRAAFGFLCLYRSVHLDDYTVYSTERPGSDRSG